MAPVPPGIRSIPVRENQDRFVHFTPKARHLRIDNSLAMRPAGTGSKFGDQLYRLRYSNPILTLPKSHHLARPAL